MRKKLNLVSLNEKINLNERLKEKDLNNLRGGLLCSCGCCGSKDSLSEGADNCESGTQSKENC